MNHAPGAHKKSANLHQAAEIAWRHFVRKIALPHIDLFWSRHLAVSNGRLPDPVSRITPDDAETYKLEETFCQRVGKPSRLIFRVRALKK
jgi:hypothetical protein